MDRELLKRRFGGLDRLLMLVGVLILYSIAIIKAVQTLAGLIVVGSKFIAANDAASTGSAVFETIWFVSLPKWWDVLESFGLAIFANGLFVRVSTKPQAAQVRRKSRIDRLPEVNRIDMAVDPLGDYGRGMPQQLLDGDERGAAAE